MDLRRNAKSELDFVKLIAELVLNPLSGGELKELYLRRTQHQEPDASLTVDSPLFDGDVLQILEAEIEEDDIEVEIRKHIEARRNKDLERQRREQDVDAVMAASAASAPAVSCHKRVLIPSSGLTQAQAKQYVPPGSYLSKEKEWHHRWKVSAPFLKPPKCKIFDPELEGADSNALKYVLTSAWQVYMKLFGGDCPFDFQTQL